MRLFFIHKGAAGWGQFRGVQMIRRETRIDRRGDSGAVSASVIGLADNAAIDPRIVGAKAAALAAAAGDRLPVLPGYVISTRDTARIHDYNGRMPDDLLGELRIVWEEMSGSGTRALVVRSSSTAEDGSESSMAGMFRSILGVATWERFVDAVLEVVASSGVVGADGSRTDAPMAVLIQPQLEASKGGILFGIDPVTGDPSRYSVAVTAGGPDALVSGKTDGSHLLMSHVGRALSQDGDARNLLHARERWALARLARRAADRFGGPQDIEWAFDRDGNLFLFQSRPVTAVTASASGPVMGPGPVAETFPDPLSLLEENLWVDPLREAVAHALSIAGSATRRAIERSPVVTTIRGRIAADLELFGVRTKPKTFFSRVDPRGPARKMMAAWRVGRLKAALPELTATVAQRVDGQLAELPSFDDLSTDELLDLLERGRATLVSLHGYEILSGLLDDADRGHMTAAELGLRALTAARNEGLDDDQIVAEHPEVLALTPPAIRDRAQLPATSTRVMGEPRAATQLGARETMRLRARWVHEAMARAAWELGRRMQATGRIQGPEQVRLLSLRELRVLWEEGELPGDFPARSIPHSAPLPGMFRVATDGSPLPVSDGDGSGAKGAGGGRGMGKVSYGDPQEGEVLVVRTLDPSLAPLLPKLGGLVAETGNVLSHLAILAREFAVPTVVGLDGAMDAFAEGTVVVVDGTTGSVSEVAEA